MSTSSTEFLTLGQHCSEASCHQLDFLPFKCPSCRLAFCSDHWRPPQGHKCDKFDENAADNRIPSCPLCLTPVSYPPASDPNIVMDRHLSLACPKLNPDVAPPKPKNVCHERRCKTKMIVPIKCDACREEFCAKHRWGADHGCQGRPAAAVAQKAVNGGGKPVFGSATGKASGLAALRRAQKAVASASMANVKKTGVASTSGSGSGSGSSKAPLGSSANPIVLDDDDEDSDIETVEPGTKSAGVKKSISEKSKSKQTLAGMGLGSKTDKRALAEQESARRALEARAKKGLLTENEKVRYATLQALDHKKGSKSSGEGCALS